LFAELIKENENIPPANKKNQIKRYNFENFNWH